MTKLIKKFLEGGTAYRASYSLPEIKVTDKLPEWFKYLNDYDKARLKSGLINTETAKSIALKRATGTSQYMQDVNELSWIPNGAMAVAGGMSLIGNPVAANILGNATLVTDIVEAADRKGVKQAIKENAPDLLLATLPLVGGGKNLLKKGINKLGFNISRVKKSKNSSQELSNIADNELLADIRYGRNRKRVKVMSPKKTETVTTIDGKTVDPATLVVEEKPTVNGFIVEQVVPGQPVYAYNGRPVLSNNVRNQEWFKYEGKYRPKSDIKTETTTTPSLQIEVGKEIPEGAWVINQKTGKPELLDGQIWRTPEGWGRKSYIYANGIPVEWYRNPGFWKLVGAWTVGTGTTSALLFGAKNVGKGIKGAGKGTISGNGAISGIVNEFNDNKSNNQDSINNDTVSPYTLTEKDIEELSDTSAYDY